MRRYKELEERIHKLEVQIHEHNIYHESYDFVVAYSKSYKPSNYCGIQDPPGKGETYDYVRLQDALKLLFEYLHLKIILEPRKPRYIRLGKRGSIS